jgi:hypothetical protein
VIVGSRPSISGFPAAGRHQTRVRTEKLRLRRTPTPPCADPAAYAGSAARRRLIEFGQLGEARERATKDARDLHLRYADPLGDLGLGEILDEPEQDDPALAL